MMRSRLTRVAFLIVGAAALFASVALIGLQVMPRPHTSADLMVIGSIATFVSLGAVFGVLILTWTKSPDTFYKRRSKPSDFDQ